MVRSVRCVLLLSCAMCLFLCVVLVRSSARCEYESTKWHCHRRNIFSCRFPSSLKYIKFRTVIISRFVFVDGWPGQCLIMFLSLKRELNSCLRVDDVCGQTVCMCKRAVDSVDSMQNSLSLRWPLVLVNNFHRLMCTECSHIPTTIWALRQSTAQTVVRLHVYFCPEIIKWFCRQGELLGICLFLISMNTNMQWNSTNAFDRGRYGFEYTRDVTWP